MVREASWAVVSSWFPMLAIATPQAGSVESLEMIFNGINDRRAPQPALFLPILARAIRNGEMHSADDQRITGISVIFYRKSPSGNLMGGGIGGWQLSGLFSASSCSNCYSI